jgi:hypothetical protein
MKKTTLIIAIVLVALQTSAQKRKSLYIELLGNGIVLSENFELRLKKNSNSGSGVRLGVGFGSVSGYDQNGNYDNVGLITIPIGYNYLIGEKRSSLELGGGITPVIFINNKIVKSELLRSGSDKTITGFLNAGYRYQPLKSGFMGKITWTPAITNSGFFAAYFGLGLGYSFK